MAIARGSTTCVPRIRAALNVGCTVARLAALTTDMLRSAQPAAATAPCCLLRLQPRRISCPRAASSFQRARPTFRARLAPRRAHSQPVVPCRSTLPSSPTRGSSCVRILLVFGLSALGVARVPCVPRVPRRTWPCKGRLGRTAQRGAHQPVLLVTCEPAPAARTTYWPGQRHAGRGPAFIGWRQ